VIIFSDLTDRAITANGDGGGGTIAQRNRDLCTRGPSVEISLSLSLSLSLAGHNKVREVSHDIIVQCTPLYFVLQTILTISLHPILSRVDIDRFRDLSTRELSIRELKLE